MTPASLSTHTMLADCEYCQGAHRGTSDRSLEEAGQDLWRQIADCRSRSQGMTTNHYPEILNYNDNFIKL